MALLFRQTHKGSCKLHHVKGGKKQTKPVSKRKAHRGKAAQGDRSTCGTADAPSKKKTPASQRTPAGKTPSKVTQSGEGGALTKRKGYEWYAEQKGSLLH